MGSLSLQVRRIATHLGFHSGFLTQFVLLSHVIDHRVTHRPQVLTGDQAFVAVTVATVGVANMGGIVAPEKKLPDTLGLGPAEGARWEFRLQCGPV